MPALTLDFSSVWSHSEIAAALGVPVLAVSAIALSPTLCRTIECRQLLAVNNHGFCILSSQSWFPRELDKKGRPATNRRGYGLYGLQFLRKTDGSTNPKSCSCSSPLCEKLGYSHRGMFTFPSDPILCAEAMRVLGIPASQRKKIIESPRKHWIAPWHFSHLRRFRDKNGRWRLRQAPSFKDAEGKSFKSPPAQRKHSTFH